MERDQARIILLAAKAASDRRCGYPDFVVRQPERVGERLVHVTGTAWSRRRAPPIGVEPGGHGLALDIDMLLQSRPVFPFNDEVSGCQGRLDVATFEIQGVERLLSVGRTQVQDRFQRRVTPRVPRLRRALLRLGAATMAIASPT